MNFDTDKNVGATRHRPLTSELFSCFGGWLKIAYIVQSIT